MFQAEPLIVTKFVRLLSRWRRVGQRLLKVAIANERLFLAAQDSLSMVVVLELQPIVARVLQEKGLMLEHFSCKSHLGCSGKRLIGLFHAFAQRLPLR